MDFGTSLDYDEIDDDDDDDDDCGGSQSSSVMDEAEKEK